jgi:hypothetical protein
VTTGDLVVLGPCGERLHLAYRHVTCVHLQESHLLLRTRYIEIQCTLFPSQLRGTYVALAAKRTPASVGHARSGRVRSERRVRDNRGRVPTMASAN